ncbi:MAG TPA: hypothetical protein VNX68_01470 [Nitrosopumilaceae archaeon]|jgi:hypothetical protein|nr:hypothetical protein [Nitrosopumilaceae archaeon]
MSEIIKFCQAHGDLSIENIKQTVERGKFILRCRICTNENARKYRKENHEKLLEYRRNYRQEKRSLNPQKVRVYKKRKVYDPNTTEIIRKCKVHGALYKEQCFFKVRNGLVIQSQCRECAKNKSLKRYEEQKQNIINQHKEYRERERAKIDERARIYREKNKKWLAEKAAARRKSDPEKYKKLAKENRQKHSEKIKIRNKKYVEANKKKVRERAKRYNIRMKDHLRKKRKIWKSKVIEELTDGYVKTVLSSQGFGSAKNLTPELIDLKRISIKVGRLKKNRRLVNVKHNDHENA